MSILNYPLTHTHSHTYSYLQLYCPFLFHCVARLAVLVASFDWALVCEDANISTRPNILFDGLNLIITAI